VRKLDLNHRSKRAVSLRDEMEQRKEREWEWHGLGRGKRRTLMFEKWT
jgi:hypothetical protein